jgi:cytochrome b561
MPGFTGAMQAMHWITVILLLGAYSAAWMIDADSSSAETDWLVMLHRSFGVMILLLTGLRLAVRRNVSTTLRHPGSEFKLYWAALPSSFPARWPAFKRVFSASAD